MRYRCSKCNTEYEEKRFFCSSCGFGLIKEIDTEPQSFFEDDLVVTDPDSPSDFFSGEMASGGTENGQQGSDDPLVYVPPSTSPVQIKISYSREFFEKVVRQGEVLFPDEEASSTVLELLGDEIYIGRKDEARNFYPEIDLSVLTVDTAVSTQHGILRISANGDVTITDLGSTNGTFVGSVLAKPLEAHIPTEIDSGTPIFLGAWSCITVNI